MKKSLVLSMMLAMGFTACASQSKTKTLRLSHPQPESHPIHTATLNFAKLVEEKSGGRYKVEVFPASQLGTPAAQIEMVQTGVLEIVMSSFVMFEGFLPAYKAFNLPYIYKSREHFLNALYGPDADALYSKLSTSGFLVLAAYETGFRNFYAKKPINSIADIRGLKLRVQESETMIKMVNSLGGQATPLAYGEVFTAIQQNVIDGAENNPISYVSTGHYEVAKNYSITEHSSVPDGLIISTKFFNALSDADKKIFRDAANESTATFSESWNKINEDELAKVVKEKGVIVTTPDKAAFRAKLIYMQDDLVTQDPTTKEVIDYINSKG